MFLDTKNREECGSDVRACVRIIGDPLVHTQRCIETYSTGGGRLKEDTKFL